ncbi:hypothetical protein I203_108108 [Kwoniella mangroviensis CBS 8507]|uniref:hypothetical protein n=1 Tax=Kwoniella mangroviensis CBS 8507 TaxID=1296122 RepID=UPI00080CE4C7|nr:uncharacterized protein I203_05002 [Kwoniella mangroviensis CBS 8507]OCF65980.1 hypothetical protein I203_05002 [Kwoniella mangroviensis CBS 8507]
MTSLASDTGSSGTPAIIRSSVGDQDTHHSKDRMNVEPRNTQTTSKTLADRPDTSSADPEDPPNHSSSTPATDTQTQCIRLSRTRQVLVIVTMSMISMLDAICGQALNISMPTIQEELNMNESDLQWLQTAFHLAVGSLLVFFGKVADNFGRKRLLLLGIMIFGGFQLIGGFMSNGAALITTRALSGVGLAMCAPSATGILAEYFTGKARSIAFTCFGMGIAIGGASRILIGGLFVSYVRYTWRSIMFFLSGLSLLILIMIIVFVPWDHSHAEDRRMDWVGVTLLAGGLAMFLFAITDAQNAPDGWKTPYIIAILLLGILSVTTFFFWEHHIANKTSRPPLMRPALWTRAHGRLSALYFTSSLGNLGYIDALYNATLYFQQLQETGSTGAMLRYLPIEISGIICYVLVALVIHKVPAYWLMLLGLLACGFANMCFALSEEVRTTGNYHFMGCGSQLWEWHLFQSMLRLGISVGLSLMAIINTSVKNKNLGKGKDETESLLRGLQSGFWLSAAACWLGVFVVATALKGLGTVGKDESQSSEASNSPENDKGKDQGNSKKSKREGGC